LTNTTSSVTLEYTEMGVSTMAPSAGDHELNATTHAIRRDAQVISTATTSPGG
jgi:hypothetical protein